MIGREGKLSSRCTTCRPPPPSSPLSTFTLTPSQTGKGPHADLIVFLNGGDSKVGTLFWELSHIYPHACISEVLPLEIVCTFMTISRDFACKGYVFHSIYCLFSYKLVIVTYHGFDIQKSKSMYSCFLYNLSIDSIAFACHVKVGGGGHCCFS